MSDRFKVPGMWENPVQNMVAICHFVSLRRLIQEVHGKQDKHNPLKALETTVETRYRDQLPLRHIQFRKREAQS